MKFSWGCQTKSARGIITRQSVLVWDEGYSWVYSGMAFYSASQTAFFYNSQFPCVCVCVCVCVYVYFHCWPWSIYLPVWILLYALTSRLLLAREVLEIIRQKPWRFSTDIFKTNMFLTGQILRLNFHEHFTRTKAQTFLTYTHFTLTHKWLRKESVREKGAE